MIQILSTGLACFMNDDLKHSDWCLPSFTMQFLKLTQEVKEELKNNQIGMCTMPLTNFFQVHYFKVQMEAKYSNLNKLLPTHLTS